MAGLVPAIHVHRARFVEAESVAVPPEVLARRASLEGRRRRSFEARSARTSGWRHPLQFKL